MIHVALVSSSTQSVFKRVHHGSWHWIGDRMFWWGDFRTLYTSSKRDRVDGMSTTAVNIGHVSLVIDCIKPVEGSLRKQFVCIV